MSFLTSYNLKALGLALNLNVKPFPPCVEGGRARVLTNRWNLIVVRYGKLNKIIQNEGKIYVYKIIQSTQLQENLLMALAEPGGALSSLEKCTNVRVSKSH